MTTRATVDAFLAQRRLAFAGVSRNPLDFSRSLFREFRRRGYDAVPVNPQVAEIDGIPCYPAISAIPQPVEAAILLTRADVTDGVVEDCARAGVRQIWLYRAGGNGAVTPAAERFCREHEIAVVAGECPFMFFPDTGWFHRLHGCWRKLRGRYPN